MSASNKEVVQAFIEDVINQGRLERANDLVKEDFVELDPLPGQEQGREGLKAVIHALRSAFPDMRSTIHCRETSARRASPTTRPDRRTVKQSPRCKSSLSRWEI